MYDLYETLMFEHGWTMEQVDEMDYYSFVAITNRGKEKTKKSKQVYIDQLGIF